MAIKPTLTDSEVSSITNALSIAAELFEGYAKDMANPRVSEQFARQAKESRALIVRLDEEPES